MKKNNSNEIYFKEKQPFDACLLMLHMIKIMAGRPTWLRKYSILISALTPCLFKIDIPALHYNYLLKYDVLIEHLVEFHRIMFH